MPFQDMAFAKLIVVTTLRPTRPVKCRNRLCLAVNVPGARLESEFVDYLERFTPQPAYLTLFREIVLDAWRERHAEAADARKRLEIHLGEAKRRREQLEDAFIYARTIDRATYERQSDKLAEDQTVTSMALDDARLDALDVEGVLAFAEHLMLNVARMWTEASTDQKQRLQLVLFPAGVRYGPDGFGITETSLAFQMLRAIAAPETSEVCLTGPSWNQLPAWARRRMISAPVVPRSRGLALGGASPTDVPRGSVDASGGRAGALNRTCR